MPSRAENSPCVVVECIVAGVPLIAVTADRPPELHHVGAPQTVEQDGLYGGATRWSVAPGVAGEGPTSWWRGVAARSVAEAYVAQREKLGFPGRGEGIACQAVATVLLPDL